MIKSFRRSKRASNSSPSPKKTISRISSRHSDQLVDDAVLQSPKKVIKALYDYQPQGPGELPFNKGDFFHVLHEDTPDSNGWYEATNPMTHVRGMVPISYFEVFNRSRPMNPPANQPAHVIESDKKSPASQTLYAVTLYEFKAERDDELDINPGENLIICAHHDYEWFIAKPINRLGGPGLVPSSYVKIIDLVNPANSHSLDQNPVETINRLKIPTVEQWKDQTAKYQASTIPLGSISSINQLNSSSNSQYFNKEGEFHDSSNRSSLSSNKINILETSVDSYQLDHGRYQYLIIARLSNGRTRHLYRYYQDFYDLQVKLLELFPYEAGKIENSRRIIPSIPGPLINVNDSISKLRREKLDYYLKNLIALPNHISRSEEVLSLFENLDNGFDKEFVESPKNRTSKPISQQSNYQQDRLSQYSNFHNYNNNNRNSTTPTSSDSTLNRSASSASSSNGLLNNTTTTPPITNQYIEPHPQQTKLNKVKVKFYYQDDIFVLLLPTNLRLQDLKSKLFKRLDLQNNEESFDYSRIQLFLKNDFDDFIEENGLEPDSSFNDLQQQKVKEFEIYNDERFQASLFDKCKIIIRTL